MDPGSPQPDSPTAADHKTEEQEAVCPGTSSIDSLPADVVLLDKTDDDNESIDSAVLQETTSEYPEDGSFGENTEESSEKPIPPSIEAQKQTKRNAAGTGSRRSSRQAKRSTKPPAKKRSGRRAASSADDLVRSPPAPPSCEDLLPTPVEEDPVPDSHQSVVPHEDDAAMESMPVKSTQSDKMTSDPGRSKDLDDVSGPGQSVELYDLSGPGNPMEPDVSMESESHPGSVPESPTKLNQTCSSGLSSESEPINTQVTGRMSGKLGLISIIMMIK